MRKISLIFMPVFGFLFIYCLASCRNTPKQVQPTMVDITKKGSASDFFNGYKYVVLETTKESIVPEPVKAVRVTDKYISLLANHEVIVFDNEGCYKGKISHQGHGNHEYLGIEDFQLCDDTLWILSRADKKLLSYTISGVFLNEIKLSDAYSEMAFVDDHRLFLASANANSQKFNFILYDTEENKILNRFDPFDKDESMVFDFPSFIGKSEGRLYVTHPFDASVYRLTQNDFMLQNSYKFNTDCQLPDETSFMKLYEASMNANVVRNVSLYYEDKGCQLLSFPLFGECGITDRLVKFVNNEQTAFYSILETFDEDFPYLSKPYGIYNDYLISVMSAGNILYIENENGVHKFKDAGIKDEDNLVVFFHRIALN